MVNSGSPPGWPVRVTAAQVGDQDDAVAEKWDAGAAGHEAFLQLDIGDAAFVDHGVVEGGDALGDGMPVLAQGSGEAGERGQSALLEVIEPAREGCEGVTSRLSSMLANRRTRPWVCLSSGR